MDGLIQRGAAAKIVADMRGLCRGDVLRGAVQAINELPAVDAAPVVHGKWIWMSSTIDRIPCEMRYRCSECNHETITHVIDPWEDYCPHCGAKMDKEG